MKDSTLLSFLFIMEVSSLQNLFAYEISVYIEGIRDSD